LTYPAVTLNRLCGSGLNAVGSAARAIRAGEADLLLAGGVESMSRAPFVMPKADIAVRRANALYDTTIGWRFVNPQMKAQYGVDSMPETAENVADDFGIDRADQDAIALRSRSCAPSRRRPRLLRCRDRAGDVPQKRARPIVVARTNTRARPRWRRWRKLKPIVRPDGTITAGNASGVNDGACALLLASAGAAKTHGLTPRARVRRHGDRRRRAARHGHRAGAGVARSCWPAWA
jgi:acetyl-CoA acyltransferase